jgi:hypothetical protein
METAPESERDKNQVMTKLRKLLVVVGAVLVVLELLFAGLGRAHLPPGRLRSIRRYASHLPKGRR